MRLPSRAWPALLTVVSLLLVAAPARALAPDTNLGANFIPQDINASGQVAGNLYVGGKPEPRRWTPNTGGGTMSALNPPAGFFAGYAFAINDSGAVGGRATAQNDRGSKSWSRPVIWSSGGAATALGAFDSGDDEGNGAVLALNNAGVPAGAASRYFNGSSIPTSPWPFIGDSNLVGGDAGGSVESLNSAGVGVGSGTRYSGGTATPLGFNPRKILDDGTIVGDPFGGGSPIIRAPDGTKTSVPCGGSIVWDANADGEILALGSSKQYIWHDGACYALQDVVPDKFAGWTFEGIGASDGRAALSSAGQIATLGTPPGGGTRAGLVFTPKYPFAIRIVRTPTTTPGRFDFDVQAVRGSLGTGTTTWKWGDGTSSTTGAHASKTYTKPGTYTVTATSTDTQGHTATTTLAVTVAAPRLVVGVTVPSHPAGKVRVGEIATVKVDVAATKDGVGELSDITFDRGTFTADPTGPLAFTTASTSPFSLSPGAGNSYPLKVRAVLAGKVTLRSLVLGKDALGRPVSATATATLEVVAGGSTTKPPPKTSLGSKTKVTSSVSRVSAAGGVSVGVRNGNAFTVKGRAHLVGVLAKASAGAVGKKKPKAKAVALTGWKSFKLPAKGKRTVALKLGKRARAALKAKGKLGVKLVLELRGPTGRKRTVPKALTLRPARRRGARPHGR